MSRTFKSGADKKIYYDRLEEYDRTGSWPKGKGTLSKAQGADEAHEVVHPEEQKPAAAPSPTPFKQQYNAWDR
jgi:hypothetical protein